MCGKQYKASCGGGDLAKAALGKAINRTVGAGGDTFYADLGNEQGSWRDMNGYHARFMDALLSEDSVSWAAEAAWNDALDGLDDDEPLPFVPGEGEYMDDAEDVPVRRVGWECQDHAGIGISPDCDMCPLCREGVAAW